MIISRQTSRSMSRRVKATKVNGQESEWVCDRDPEICPVCGIACRPIFMNLASVRSNKDWLEVVFRCPREECGALYFAGYGLLQSGTALLQKTTPSENKKYAATKEVANISSRFEDIFNQALKAESLGLSEIAGMGYRKALEFLIKDYCISKNPEKEDAVKKTRLGPCIQNFVSEPNVKICAERATWLGNDETHYTRQWQNHDIEDLKRLVRLTENWISNEVATASYLADMQKPTK